MTGAPTVHLVDALPYVFRAWFSVPSSLVDGAGRPINALYGFADMCLRYLAEERPTHLAFCFDESLDSSFRNQFYPAYKSSREPAPPELLHQLEGAQELCRALGAAVFADELFEADDLIGTLVERARSAGAGAVVVSNDKDLGQLVGPQVEYYDFARGERRDRDGVRSKLGVFPEQIPDWIGLAGDAVDDIPGVAGIGTKTAVSLLEHFGDLDRLYADLGAVAAAPLRGARSVAAKLERGRELAFLSRRLATIARDAPLDLPGQGLDGLRLRSVDRAATDQWCERYGLGKHRERLALRGGC
jgi:DNA polymerase-1